MKLIVLIGTDCHLELLPHFLEHYSRIGVNLFLCGLHGERRDEAQALLARYRFEVVVDFGAIPYAEELTKQWAQISNQVRRQHAEPGEWCLYADVDEFHEYPPDFFASLDQSINAVRGWWVERLATSDGQLLPCLPGGNIGQQFPFATQKIFCGLSEKVMAVRADLDLSDGYHWIVGGGDSPMFHQDYLRVHHFRWDNHAAAKYASIRWTGHYKFKDGRVPDLRGVFYMNPPFPPVGSCNGVPHPKVSVILRVQDAASQVCLAIRSIRSQTLSEWELIVVDTEASDQTKATLHLYANGDERIRVVAASGPLREARRIGFLSARGGYIYCLDANHCCLPDTLQRLCGCLDTQLEAPVAYGVLDSLTPESNPLHAFKQLGTDGFLNTGAVAVRRSALNAALADPECDFEDQSLWWSLLREGPAAFVEGKALSISNPLSSACSVMASASGAPEMKQAPLKLAYLIAAHYQPAHLGRLVRALNHENSYFFIHIDAKADLPFFQAAVPPWDNVIFVADRVTVEWGWFGVLDATLNLIRAAVTSGHSFRYFTILSGSDYPIKHRETIAKRLSSGNRQYLRVDRRPADPGNTHSHFLKNLPNGRYFGDMVPYHGAAFWSLTADCISFILDFIAKNPGYVDIHRHILFPEEIFFQTLVKHSPFADAITQDFSAGSWPDQTRHGNHFIDWQGLRERNYINLDERDFDDLLTCDALFARKFDEGKSHKLLDLLDLYVHGCDLGQLVLQ